MGFRFQSAAWGHEANGRARSRAGRDRSSRHAKTGWGRRRFPKSTVKLIPPPVRVRVPLAAAAADRLAAVVTAVAAIVGSTVVTTVVAAAVSASGNSAVAPVSDGLRLIDAQLYTTRRYLR